MTSATELLPCPFCGGEAKSILGTIYCGSCGFSFRPFFSSTATIEAWNTRSVETCILEGSYSMGGWLDEREPIWTFDFSCGHSFTSLDNEPPAHCPECGRKVSE